MKNEKLFSTRDAQVDYRFATDTRDKIYGDWEGLKITNYQIAGEHAAERMKSAGSGPVLEVCTGIGATTFVLAQTFPKVYAVDKSVDRLSLTRENLKRLHLLHKVELILGDVTDKKLINQLASCKITSAYTDVDWNTKSDWTDWVTDINLTGPSTSLLFETLTKNITGSICMKLPKTINLNQVRELGRCEIEEIKPDQKLSFYVVYFGELMKQEKSIFVFPKHSYM